MRRDKAPSSVGMSPVILFPSSTRLLLETTTQRTGNNTTHIKSLAHIHPDTCTSPDKRVKCAVALWMYTAEHYTYRRVVRRPMVVGMMPDNLLFFRFKFLPGHDMPMNGGQRGQQTVEQKTAQ